MLYDKHGMTNSPEYKHWFAIKHRCKHKDYYVKKGITVCPEWINSFSQFYADMGDKPSPNHTIDRINNDLGYSPTNCRWATQEEQQNNKTNNRNLTYNGITQTLAQWAREYDFIPEVLSARLQKGMTIEEALNTPKKHSKLSETHTMNGITKTIKEWLIEYNRPRPTFHHRVNSGMTITDAIITPSQRKTR